MLNPPITRDPQGRIAPTVVVSSVTVESTDSVASLAHYIHTGYIVLWQHHAVFVIPVQEGAFTPPPTMEEAQSVHLIRARAFNQDREWHVWRTEDGLQGRKREDATDGQPTETLDTQAKLRGVIVKQLNDRHPEETWVVQTRNYIGYNTFHHAGYIDSRFMDIFKFGKESKS